VSQQPIFEGRLFVHYGQAYVFSGGSTDTSDMPRMFPGQANGLLGSAQPGRLFLITGLHTGSAHLLVEVADAAPPDEDGEECVEASFTPEAGDARLVDWDGNTVCALPLTAATTYRVRYCATGMDAARKIDTLSDQDMPVDSYLLAFWTAPTEPDRVVLRTGETAAFWHEWAAGITPLDSP
jgi:hypothetical protein